eukprot:COSAG02_NODE_3054_length_7458_cov_5.759750_3_plen_108_part_00
MVRRAGHGTGVVMCGDFNSEHSPGAGGGVYQLLSTGRLSVEHEDHPVARRSADSMADLTCTPMSSAYAQNGWVRLSDSRNRQRAFLLAIGLRYPHPLCDYAHAEFAR